MAAVAHLTANALNTDLAAYTTGVSGTPTIGDLLVVSVFVTASVSTAPTLTESAGGGSYTYIGKCVKATSLDEMYCFVRNSLCENATSRTWTFTSSPSDAGTSALFEMIRVTGMSRAGALAVRQSAAGNNGAAAGTPSVVLPGVALTANPVIATMCNATNPATLTAPATFTELADIGTTLPTCGSEYASVNSGFTSNTVTWGSTSATAWGAFALELDTTATPIKQLSALGVG